MIKVKISFFLKLKIIFLFVNSNISQPAMLSLDKLKPVRNDILAYGLRNPWKIVEYKNYLFIKLIK